MGVAALIFGGFILTMEVARAETIVVSDVIPARNTNWSDVLEIPAFEHQWGMLTSITLTFMTPITGFVSFENTSDEHTLITTTHAVSVLIGLPNHQLLSALPSAERVDSSPPFDGVADFRGESGRSFYITSTAVITQVLTDPLDLALFYGSAPIIFPITATGESKILGPGNFDAIFRAQAAGAAFTVYFAYQPPEFEVEKYTNGRSADNATGNDVPSLLPGAPITWTYLITNTGIKAIPFADIAVTDSDPTVTPIFDSSSDDGDLILAPGEVWRYYATGNALDLRLNHTDRSIVDGCQGVINPQTLRAYENTVTVRVEDVHRSDPSHYCNPTVTRRLEASLLFKKLINGQDANNANGIDVPQVLPGNMMTWTYVITNTGELSFTFSQINLTDDDPALTIVFDVNSDNGDQILSPGEVWYFHAIAAARNLQLNTADITIVPGCDPSNSDSHSAAYRNVAVLRVNTIILSDPAHYCNIPPTAVSNTRDDATKSYRLYMPLVEKLR